MAFGIADYIVFGVTLLICVTIGLYYRFSGGKQKTNEEYLLGSKNQSVFPVACSLVASFASSISILGYTGEVYSFGTQFYGINVAYLFSTPIAAIFYLPVLFKNNTVSVYEYLEKRFGRLTRLLASLAFTIQMILYMGIVHYAPAIALEAVTGISQVHSILLIGLICIFYSVIGGIKAVIIIDMFQYFLMLGSVFTIIIVSIVDAGGFTNIWNEGVRRQRVQFSNFDPDPTQRHSWWTVIIGGFFTHINIYAVNQAQVQRYVSMKSYKSAAYALLLSCPILILFMMALCVAGLCLFHFYRDCDPIREGRITSADQLVPLYVMDRLNSISGLTGIFIAGIFSASLSTVSAAVNSLAAVTLEDYIKPAYKYFWKENLNTYNSNLSKMLAIVYGIICVIVALLIRDYKSLLQHCLVIFGIVGGPLFALFTAGIMIPFVNEIGAVFGFLAGLVFCFLIGFGGPKPRPVTLPTSINGCNSSFMAIIQETLMNTTKIAETSVNFGGITEYSYIFRISYLYYIVLGFCITLTLSILVSLAIPDHDANLEPELFTPLVAAYLSRRTIKEETVYMYDVKQLERMETM